jgi:hypothetical protein
MSRLATHDRLLVLHRFEYRFLRLRQTHYTLWLHSDIAIFSAKNFPDSLCCRRSISCHAIAQGLFEQVCSVSFRYSDGWDQHDTLSYTKRTKILALMGQYWQVINLDKRQTLGVWGKIGDCLFGTSAAYLVPLLKQSK